MGRYKIRLYAGTPAMNVWYLDGNNPNAEAGNQQERSYGSCNNWCIIKITYGTTKNTTASAETEASVFQTNAEDERQRSCAVCRGVC